MIIAAWVMDNRLDWSKNLGRNLQALTAFQHEKCLKMVLSMYGEFV